MFLPALNVTLSPALTASSVVALPSANSPPSSAPVTFQNALLIAFATSFAVAKLSPALSADTVPLSASAVRVAFFTSNLTALTAPFSVTVTFAVVPVPSTNFTVS